MWLIESGDDAESDTGGEPGVEFGVALGVFV